MARLRFGRPISLRWNGLLLEGPANTVFEIPDEFYEEFNGDIGPVEPTLVWLDSDEASTLRGRVTALEGAGSATLSSDAALALGTASAGVGTEASRDDHVHPTTGLSLSSHNHDGSYATTGHNHSGVYEVAGAVSSHVGQSDPHTQYLTETSASSTYATTGHNHLGTYEPVNTAILKSVVDAKGDLIVGTASDTVDRLPGSGTNGHVLTYDSAETTGLKWAAAPGSGGGASVGNATPLALGTASAGDDAAASREDHVHPTTGLSLSGHDHDATYVPIAEAGRADIVYETCKNSSGGTIAKGKVVYIDGADGTNPTIALSDADTEATSSKTLGFTETASNNGDQVNVIIYGRLTNVDTSAASAEGVSVWLSSTAGGVVFGAPPAEPAHSVYLGVVTKKNASTGEIFVKVQNGYELDELHDVSAASPSDNDIIQWDSATQMWKKESLSTAGIASSSHNHSGVYDPAGTASSAISTHVGESDPHTQYLTETAASSTYSTTSHDHSGVYDPAGTTSTHAALTTSVHGISDTANLVYTSDSRLSDSRTPTAHKTSHSTGGTDALTATDIGAATSGHTHSFLPLSGGTLTGDLTVNVASGHLTLNSQTDLRLADSDSSNWVAIQAPATVPSNVTWTLPSADGTSGQVISTNGTGTLSWITPASPGGAAAIGSTSTKTGSNYNLLTSDLNVFIRMNNASANTVTVGTSLNTLADGSLVHIQQIGTGKTTVVASGVTITATPTLGLRSQHSSATLIKIGGTGTNVWTLVGDLSV
jgi:hypothetical protein